MSPYIPIELRNKIPETPGELNHQLTRDITSYLTRKVGRTPHQLEPNYTDWNEVLGVLTAIIQEVYRRKIAPYEDEKKEEHGDVY